MWPGDVFWSCLIYALLDVLLPYCSGNLGAIEMAPSGERGAKHIILQNRGYRHFKVPLWIACLFNICYGHWCSPPEMTSMVFPLLSEGHNSFLCSPSYSRFGAWRDSPEPEPLLCLCHHGMKCKAGDITPGHSTTSSAVVEKSYSIYRKC